MLMEDDWTRPVSSVTTKDVTKHGLGARGIDVIIATTGITSSNEGTPSTAFPLYDGHGNMVNSLSRASGGSFALGSSTYRYYDAWGGLDTGPGAGNEPRQRYCANLGHLQDDESGLIYMRARYYEPGTGRFVSEDPAMVGANWYAYCHGEPVDNADQTGRFSDWAGMLMIYGAMSAVTSYILAGLNELIPSLTCARISVLAFAAAFFCEERLGGNLHGLGGAVRIATGVFGGLGLIGLVLVKNLPFLAGKHWLTGVLGAAAQNAKAGNNSLASLALLGGYVYTLTLCGALIGLQMMEASE